MRLVLIFGAALAGLALLVTWMDFRLVKNALSVELYTVSIALIFAILGIWLGNHLTSRPRSAVFARNTKALSYLKVSPRECEVLDLLAEGYSNKVIARRLSISPNTVKSHVSRLFEKLEATSRTQLIIRARTLELIP